VKTGQGIRSAVLACPISDFHKGPATVFLDKENVHAVGDGYAGLRTERDKDDAAINPFSMITSSSLLLHE
jgi:hypothetical protein